MAKENNKVVYLKTAIILGSVLVVFMIWLWWTLVFNNKQAIFESMISNSLSTTGYTKTIQQESAGQSLSQVSQAQFGAQNVVQVKTDISQGSDDSATKVSTSIIGLPDKNFARYTSIEVADNENKDFGDISKKWGIQTEEEGGGSVFSESVFGLILFGNLSPDQRGELIDFANEKTLYVPNYDDVQTEEIDGNKVYTYPVTVNTKAYVELIKKYDELLGLGLTNSFNIEDYEQAPPINAKLSIDAVSRQLVKLEYTDNGRTEMYSGYGVKKEVDIPDNPISRQELEEQLQTVLE